MEENPVKILLVEDDEDDYFIIEDLLNGAPLRCELDWVDGYEAGLKGVCSGEYDVTLLDYRLGERSGMDLLREALERGCRTPMILLTGQGDYEVDMEAMGSGASDYLVKDQLNEALLERSIRYSIERARTLEELRENEERFRALVQRGSDIITILEADATIRYESPSVERILGYDPEEMVGRNVFEYLHPDDVERARAVLQDSLEKPTLDRQLEVRFRHADGSWRHLEALGSNLLGVPAIRGIVINSRDITLRREAEEKLRRSERSLAQAQRIAHLGSWEYSIEEDVARWSDEVYRIFGFEPGEITPDYKTFFQAVYPQDRKNLKTEIQTAVAGEGASFSSEFRIVRHGGAVRSVEAQYELVRNERGEPVEMVGTIQDITERKEYEEELRRSNAELQQFAYVASHDLQEPLRMISSYMQLLERRYKDQLDESAKEFIEYAVDGANRMQRLINDLLKYSRVGTRGRELAPTELTGAYQAALSNLKIAIEESGAEVTADALPTVKGDETQLTQLLQNLIGNAIKFRNEGVAPEVRVGAERRNGEWLISVEDNGVGIDPAYTERIFLIFQRLHGREQYEGTGIGLAVCMRIVERHGGSIWVESEPGEGSVFYFTLPAANK